MEQKEKLSTALTAMGSALTKEASGSGGEKPTEGVVDIEVVNTIVKDWNALPKKAVKQTLEKYGAPNEATPSRLIWYNTGPWKRTLIYRDEVPHNFPAPHTDVVEQWIDYKVPPEKAGEIIVFDGSLLVERTKGEVGVRCDMEAANFIAINLMHEIVTGNRTVEDARKEYGEAISAFLMNRPSPYAEGFTFELPTGKTADVDEIKIGAAMLEQIGKKIKDAVNGR
ncbi:MAG: hypothetical protein ABR503_15035 [Chitinophagaceae bacterium]